MKTVAVTMRKLWAFIIASIAVFALTANVYAAYSTPMNVSNDSIAEGDFLLLSNGDIAYNAGGNGGGDVFLYDSATQSNVAIANTAAYETISYSTNARGDFLFISNYTDLYLRDGVSKNIVKINTAPIGNEWPLLDANGGIIWQQLDAAGQNDVWYKSLTGTATNISNTTNNEYAMSFYSAGANNYIVYTRNTAGTLSVQRYNIASQATTDMTASYGVNGYQWYSPNGDIVWTDGVSPDQYIKRYTAATNVVAPVAGTQGDGIDDGRPQINSYGDIVWIRNIPITSGLSPQLYRMPAGGVPAAIVNGWTGNTVNGMQSFSVLGNGDVAYVALDASGFPNLFVFDRTTGVSTNVSKSSVPSGVGQAMTNASGDAVWASPAPGGVGSEIYAFTKSSNIVDRLTNNTVDDYYPQIGNDGKVVWWGWDGVSDTEIFSATRVPAPTVSISANPISVASGGSSTLSWSSTNATSCTASGAWSGAKGVSGSQLLTNLTATATYSLSCAGAGGTTAASVTITVIVSGNTGLLTVGANYPVTTNAGDNNGFQTNPSYAWLKDGSFAVDPASGTDFSTSCTATTKDKHVLYNYSIAIPAGAIVKGVEVALTAKVDSVVMMGTQKMCVQLSSDAGVTWVTKSVNLTTANTTYTLGGATDIWGRTWTASNLSNANFRLRIVNVASSSRTFYLDTAQVRVHY